MANRSLNSGRAKRMDQAQPRRIAWEGAFLSRQSLALVNRELSMTLSSIRPDWEMLLKPHASDDLSLEPGPAHRFVQQQIYGAPQNAHLWIRHHWPPNWERPSAERFVVIQPWEFGSIPRSWVSGISANVDEVWVPSNFVRECYIEGGVPANKVVVVPNGVNTAQFYPDVAPTSLQTTKQFKFLFVGGTISRKGIDVLLTAYSREFTATDDVTLIIKDFGANSFYAGQDAGALIVEVQSRPGAPEIVHLKSDISESEMAGLYAACDCLVHPYRGEGYGLPIAEAMACGVPTIVTKFGAALDFANDNNSYMIPATLTRLPEKRIGDMETVDYPFWAEPDQDALAAAMRRVVENPDSARELGRQAAWDIHTKHTWVHAAEIAVSRIETLCNEKTTTFVLPAAGNAAFEQKKQDALARTRSGDWAEANERIEACLTERPDDWDLINALGVALFRLGLKDRAKEVLVRGISSAPNPRDFHHNLAFLLLEDSDLLPALDHGCSALAVSADSEEIRRTVERTVEAARQRARRMQRSLESGGSRRAAKKDPRLLELRTAIERAEDMLAGKIEAAPARPLVSLVMIVKNEERFLRDCLESVRGINGEIIIVDTGSTDKTIEIAHEFGAKIVRHEWKDDFSEARNVSLEHASGEWALWLDADERLAKGDGQKLLKLVAETPSSIGGYMLNIRNYMQLEDTNDICWHRACRLFRNLPSVRFSGRVHEQNARPLKEAGFALSLCQINIDHYGYAHEIMAERDKHERFIRMLHREVSENPDDAYKTFHLFNLANAYYTRGDMESAAEWFERADEDPDPREEYCAMLYAEWATALYSLGRAEESLSVCDRALTLGIVEPGIHFARAHALLHQKEYDGAESGFKQAIELGKKAAVVSTGDSGAHTFKALYGLALAATGREQYNAAIRYCRESLALKPNFHDARHLLGIALKHEGRLIEARNELERMIREVGRHDYAESDLACVLYDLGEFTAALPHLRKASVLQSESLEVWTRLADCSEKLGLFEDARDAYLVVRNLAPGSPTALVNLGRMYAKSGDPSKAIDSFADAISLNPEYANSYFNAGDTLYALGAYAQAVEAISAGLKRDPNNAAGYFVLGNCYFQTGQYEAAVLTYKAALLRKPAYSEVTNNLEMAEELLANSKIAA